MEAVKTNILGTDNVLSAAIEAKVKKVICLSTDKAVYPINAMGLSKAMMEKLMLSKNLINDMNTIFCATRYGNVMCSRGSVIPLFVSQIKNNVPITITDPQMTRYLMSLDESVDLVMHAFNHGSQGDIFVQKSPACTILDLVSALKNIFNYKKENIIIGTRHGEKLYESLIVNYSSLNRDNIEYQRPAILYVLPNNIGNLFGTVEQLMNWKKRVGYDVQYVSSSNVVNTVSYTHLTLPTSDLV